MMQNWNNLVTVVEHVTLNEESDVLIWCHKAMSSGTHMWSRVARWACTVRTSLATVTCSPTNTVKSLHSALWCPNLSHSLSSFHVHSAWGRHDSPSLHAYATAMGDSLTTQEFIPLVPYILSLTIWVFVLFISLLFGTS
jgi:hypothetical protein